MLTNGRDESTRITPGKVVVSILLLVAAILTVALFFVAPGTDMFWVVVASLAITAAAALLIPLKAGK